MKDPSSSASSASNFHPGANIASAAGDAAQASAMRNDSQPGSKSPERNSPQTSVTASSAQSRSRDSIPTACLACRSKHLKCDGSHPCARCVASGSECAYVASRRGYKGPRRGAAPNPNKRQATSPPDLDASDVFPYSSASQPISMCRAFKGSSVPSTSSPGSSTGHTPLSNHSQTHRYADTSGTDISTYELSPSIRSGTVQGPLPSLAERCFDSFYQNFHAAHPFVLPKDFIFRFAREGSIEPLLSAMRWVGSLYIDVPAARESLYDEAYQRVKDSHNPRDGFLLQAHMVLIVGMDGAALNDKARELLIAAEKLAIEIAINTRPFAKLYGRGIPVLEESWRRTWWDLLVIDGMIAGVHRMTNFELFDIPADVALPCEEHQFLSGNIPPSRYLEDLEDQEFTAGDDDREFSSFSYRILCARNLGKFMRTDAIQGPDDPNLARIEALLTNWRLHLPPSKRDPLDRDGRVDEMMFQAHMMVHATSILLHQPHSQLDSSPASSVTSCAPHQAVLTTGHPFNAHTRHVIASATAISHLVTLPAASLASHTHFFTCVLTLSSIVHLSKWALRFVQYDDDDLRQLLRLNVAALSELARVWPAAERARGQVRGVAADIYRAKKQVQAAPQFWFGLTREQVMSSIAADDSIIEEISENPHAQRSTITG
ncbi:Conidial development protein fluffy-like protein [Hapsidospora chrysogenum ATCC 11550]|uniref:Conidial development protein fluffy-like protein n=1 Tax=Hapsidospora chrysogenum (strain ATCC 11550 / CBS 779.69 / DSM 880 / IAM 14645 / JCM 23072 / IMI 49137) TaxID=857340 RepID=A0A086SXG5_HAPC1|nr:Conidial development protein fluffy-like protein [Hapsidospora chrysogenum ATCC 11550]